MHTGKLKKNSRLVVALVLLFLVSYLIYRLGLRFGPEQIRAFVGQFGILGPAVFIFLVVTSIVIAPISGLPIWLGGFFAFGMPLVVVYSWSAGVIGGALGFLIARKWGRPAVKRLVGAGTITKVDEASENIGFVVLFILRVFQSHLFDVVTYGAGLTNISFRAYMTATVVGSAIPTVLFIMLFDTLTTFNWPILGIIAAWGILGLFLASIPAVWYFLQNKRQG